MASKGKGILAALLAIGICGAAACGGQGDVSSGKTGEYVPEETEVKNYWQDLRNFGIGVTEDGTMTLGGEKLYAAGVNCFDLVNGCFSEGFSAAGAKESLDVLSSYGVGVVRFDCGGYDYTSIGRYFDYKQEFIDLLREVTDYAEKLEIGLIPSFFWLKNAVPDYFDEPLRSWGRPESKTVGFLRSYTREIVSAIKDSKAVFGWEFGNEFNLDCDLPNAAEHMPPLPEGSSRTGRTEEDYLSASDVQYALSVFAEEISSLDDSGRMITSGNANPRPSQYNQFRYGTWEQDTPEEYGEITSLFAPAGVEAISEHVYFTAQKTFGREIFLEEYLQYATATAKKLKKAYFVGEWGGGDSTDYGYYRRIGNAFVDAGVQLVLLWNFNVGEGRVEYSFSHRTERGRELLKIVGEMNARYAGEYRTAD